MSKAKYYVLDILGNHNFGFPWYLGESNTLIIDYKKEDNVQIKAIEKLAQMPEVINDIRSYSEHNNCHFHKTYTVSVDSDNLYINVIGMQGSNGIMCGLAMDVTYKILDEQKMKRLAYYDELTGLPNRQLIQEFLDKEIDKSLRGLAQGAVFFMDLDKFKTVNDGFGHEYGDMLLREVAERLKKCMRSYDLVGRMSGDEFVVVQTGIKDIKETVAVAEKIIRTLDKPFKILEYDVNIDISIGISLYTQDGKTTRELLRNADKAMYIAKRKDSTKYTFYNAAAAKSLSIREDKINDLRNAIDNHNLIIQYQPQIDIKNNRICGIEALVRWDKPGHGVIKPMEFIELAEEAGLISKINEFVINKSFDDIGKLIREGLFDGRIAFNISSRQLIEYEDIKFIKQKMAEFGLSNEYVDIEVTDGFENGINEKFIKVLNSIISTGMSITIDNLGECYSYLCFLRNLPIRSLKIDKYFVQRIPETNSLISSIIEESHRYNIHVTAEGIETSNQLKQLMEYDCDAYQGYYLSTPLSIDKLREYIITCNNMLNTSYIRWINRQN